MGRTEDLRAFLRGGGSLCPYAASAERGETLQFVELEPGLPAIRAVLLLAARGFAPTSKEEGSHALLVILPEDPPYDVAQAQVEGVFLELSLAFARVTYPLAHMSKLWAYINTEIRQDLRDPTRDRPFLGCKGQHLLTVAFGPQYPAQHPRRAPVTFIALTWRHQVLAAPPSAVERIHAAMVERTGVLYDADELWLAVKPAAGDPTVPRYVY